MKPDRFLTLLLSSFVLVGCGQRFEEKQNIATSTCNIMKATRASDSVTRLREINLARADLGEPRYIGNDAELRYALKLDVCEALVLNSPTYERDLLDAKRVFDARTALLEAEFAVMREERRIAEEKAKEEDIKKRVAETTAKYEELQSNNQ